LLLAEKRNKNEKILVESLFNFPFHEGKPKLIDSIFSALPPSWFSDGCGGVSSGFGRSGVALPSDQLFFLSHCSGLSLITTSNGFAVVVWWADQI
jgi:hypothetical protein